MPVKLPIEIKDELSIKKEDYTKVKVKSEPMDIDGDKVNSQNMIKDDILKGKPEERQIKCSDLFTNSVKSGISSYREVRAKKF